MIKSCCQTALWKAFSLQVLLRDFFLEIMEETMVDTQLNCAELIIGMTEPVNTYIYVFFKLRSLLST